MEAKRKVIYFCVTNDLSTDQRMQKICTSLSVAGYEVHLIGRKLTNSLSINIEGVFCHRMSLIFTKGKLFYLEYNLRLFIFLLFRRFDAVCAIDLDSISAAFLVGVIRRKKKIYDAHEYFTEVPELEGRPFSKSIWEWVGRRFVHKSNLAYSVGPQLAEVLSQKYGFPFEVIRNVSRYREFTENRQIKTAPYILMYQGVLNEGRGLGEIIQSLEQLSDCQLWIAGDGVLLGELKEIAEKASVSTRVRFLGKISPYELPAISRQAFIGLNLLRADSLNYYYSLANKFYDYQMVGIPSINMNFPEYKSANEQFRSSLLINTLDPIDIAVAVKSLIEDPALYAALQENGLAASKVMNWELESQKLVTIYQKLWI
ncbi:MAG: glycosyltransferase [Saprospiraceae bacterium]